MSIILIDTNIASFILKGSDYAEPYEIILSGHELALSFMSVTELYQWAFIHKWGDRRIIAIPSLVRYELNRGLNLVQ